MGIIRSIKDTAVSSLGRVLINKFTLERYGEMIKFHLDSEEKQIFLSLLLKGEDKPIDAKATYNIEEKNNKTFIRLDDIQTSREWLNAVINDYLPEDKKEVELPSGLNSIIKILNL